MQTKLWNRDPINGFTSQFSLGGLPIFSDDLQASQDVSTELYGSLGLMKGWSCVLRGCLIDNLNITSKTCSITEGVVLINDVVYYIPAMTNVSYPFALIKGTETVDTRIFKDGSSQDVAISYNFGMMTNFTYPSSSNIDGTIPNNLTTDSIYFDPFTSQRIEYIMNNSAKGFGEIINVNNNINSINKTETGKQIIGGTLPAIINGSGRWKYLGYTNFANNELVLRNAVTTNVGTIAGANNIILGVNNLPAHVHAAGTLITQNAGNHSHGITVSKNVGNNGASGGFQSSAVDGSFAANISIQNAGDHNHTVAGNTEDGTAGGLKSSADSISTISNSLYVTMLEWNGYQSIQNFYNFYSNVLPYSNM